MSNEHQHLYSYWESIPEQKFVSIPEKMYFHQPIRRAIVKILSEGLLDDPNDPNSSKRYALNVAELKKLLLERKEIEVSQTNIYFHLNILEEHGFIQVAAILHEGPHKRNKTKYYGRTARRLLVSETPFRYETCDKEFQEFEKLASALEISLPENFRDLPGQFLELKNHHHHIWGNWVMEHEKWFEEEKIDFLEVLGFLKFIDNANPAYFSLLKEVHEKAQQILERIPRRGVKP